MGADWATKFQYIVMGLLILALVSFFVGGMMKWNGGLAMQNFSAPDKGLPFWVLFAIFFPAVNGFTQGVDMSGDLKDPGGSIPLGTFLAVGLSTIIYYLAAVVFAGAMPNSELMADYGAMKKVSFIPGLINAGVIAATLSSAMAALAMAAQDIDLEAEPDTGSQGELAKAEDELNEANMRYEAAKTFEQILNGNSKNDVKPV